MGLAGFKKKMWNCLFRVKDDEVRFRVKDNQSFAAKLYSQA